MEGRPRTRIGFIQHQYQYQRLPFLHGTTLPQPHLRPRLNQGYSHGGDISYSHRDDLRLAVLLIRYRFTLLPLFSTFVADPTQKIQIGWRDQCAPPRLYHRRFMNEVPRYQVDSRPPSKQIPVGLFDCCIVRLSPHPLDSVHLRYISNLYIVE